MDKLQSRANLFKALIYLSASFILATIGYAVYRLVAHQVDSLGELEGRNSLTLAGFGACLLLAFSNLKKTKAEIKARENRGINH